MNSSEHVFLPAQFLQRESVGNNRIVQLFRPEFSGVLQVEESRINGTRAIVIKRDDDSRIALVGKAVQDGSFTGDILRVGGLKVSELENGLPLLTRKSWLKIALPMKPASSPQLVCDGWHGQLHYQKSDPTTNTLGLRTPQLGALHATLAHWSIATDGPATIVMPTGTGKTETMMAIMVGERLPRLLVVVPTTALRTQIGLKFVTLGVLKSLGVVSQTAPYPIVGFIDHQFDSVESAAKLLQKCNVVVATMQVVNECSEEVRRVLAEQCSHLFIDEAHHVSAPSWNSFRQRFADKPILQFTATPYRNDGKQVGGKIIYAFPLRKAQQEGYFSRINFRPVFSYVNGDRTIAEATVDQLRNDIGGGLRHLAMARVNTIERAKELLGHYQSLAPDYNPEVIYSSLSGTKQADVLRKLRSHETKIIVCVDMLGEGFDLPEMKIAALHDVHKSLAITLQFIGRFTRAGGLGLGDATVIANRAVVDVPERLRSLYTEDPDWDAIIRDLSQDAVGDEERKSEFQQAFKTLPEEVSIQGIEPRMSTVVFKTQCSKWLPEGIYTEFKSDELYTKTIAVNDEHRVAWFVVERHEPVKWGDVRGVVNASYDLFVIHWDEENQLLYINSTDNGSTHNSLAISVTNDKTEIIKGEQVYRAMAGIHRLVPTNLGLLDTVSRNRRFTMHVGADVVDGLHPTQRQSKVKTNLFGHGYEDGERATIGCSLKGRIWSHLAAHDISEWVDWCHHIGGKLLDDTIDTEAIAEGFIKPKDATERPSLVPLAIEWPLEFLARQEDRIDIVINDQAVPFYDAGLEILTFSRTDPIRFRVSTIYGNADYQIAFNNAGMSFVPLAAEAYIQMGRSRKTLSDWFKYESPKIHFEQDAFIEKGLFIQQERDIAPYDRSLIIDWDWTGTNIRKESQGAAKASDSIQRRVIDQIIADDPQWDIVFDDDDAREAADILAIKMTGDKLVVHFYHVKFSSADVAGHRIEDLYAVCGQAQKCVYWRDHGGIDRLLRHLAHRESSRIRSGRHSRFEKGDFGILENIGRRASMLRLEYKIWIVQPGVSKATATDDMLRLLAATSLFIYETGSLEFAVIANA